jgi:hypothetical protein
MALDASLILGGKAPQLDDPLTIQAKQAKLSDLLNSQKMSQYQIEDVERGRQDAQTMASLWRESGGDPAKMQSMMAERGQGARIPAFQEQQAKTGKAVTEQQAAQLKLAQDRIKVVGARLSSRLASQNVTREDVVSDIVSLVQDGIIDMAHGERLVKAMPSDPGRLRQALIGQGMELMGENERIKLALGETKMEDMGGTRQAFNVSQLTGTVTPGQALPKTASPEALMADARARAAQGQAASQFNQRLAFDRETRGVPGVGEAGDPAQAALIKRFGKPEAGRRWKPDGSLEPIPGGSADLKTQNSEMGKGTVSDVIGSLRLLYDDLDKEGGITNPEKGTLANLSAGIASSETGQAAGRMFGTQNQSKRNTILQQRPLLLQAIMKATGMSAKQMDSNAELKLYLATATDPTLDVATNKRALDMIEQLYGVGGSGATPPSPPAAGGGWKIERVN